MSSLKAKFDFEEFLYVFFGVFCAGAVMMWFFYTGFSNPAEFPSHNAIAYLSIALVFTVLVVVFFVLIFLRKRKA